MTVSTSRTAYEDCFALLDRAMSSPAGIRHSCSTEGKANYLRTRINYSRILSRRELSAALSDDDPSLGTSPYDALIVRTVDSGEGKWWVYIEPRRLDGVTEELPVESFTNIHDLCPTDNYTENGIKRRRV